MILEVNNLKVSFETSFGKAKAVKDVSFNIKKGEILGIVGESGSGKSVTSMAIMGLLSKSGIIENGEILFKNKNLLKLNEKEMCRLRGNEISMVFQNPMTSLNPVMTIYKQLREVYKIHMPQSKNNCKKDLIELLSKLNIPDSDVVLNKYPFELSGGLKQRIVIAMAMICNPDLIIADEPTTALDVINQADIIDLLKQVKIKNNSAIMLITHDLGVIAQMAERINVMYFGQVIETCSVEEFFNHAIHPYSRDLLNAMPDNFNGRFSSIEGNVPNLQQDIEGCDFYDRCREKIEDCKKCNPQMIDINEGHSVRCIRYKELMKRKENK